MAFPGQCRAEAAVRWKALAGDNCQPIKPNASISQREELDIGANELLYSVGRRLGYPRCVDSYSGPGPGPACVLLPQLARADSHGPGAQFQSQLMNDLCRLWGGGIKAGPPCITPRAMELSNVTTSCWVMLSGACSLTGARKNGIQCCCRLCARTTVRLTPALLKLLTFWCWVERLYFHTS